MRIKKLLKLLPISVMTAGIVLATSVVGFSALKTNGYSNNQFLKLNQQVTNIDYSNQLEFIRNEVEKQTGITNSVVSIDLVDNSSSSDHSAALVTKTDGSTLLYMWGYNGFGQLGFYRFSTIRYNATPILVDPTYFGSRKITQIALGQDHSAALLEDGSLYIWGGNGKGQITLGSETRTSPPILVDPAYFGYKKITHVELGDGVSSVILEDGSLYMWGSNKFGQLGNAINSGTDIPSKTPTLVEPTYLNSKKVVQVALGGFHTAALLEDGSMYMWGQNIYGQLGNATNIGKDSVNYIPVQIIEANLNAKKITKISLGNGYSAALTEDGSLYTWGYNSNGQLGHKKNSGTADPVPTPTMVDPTYFDSKKVIQIGFGFGHSAAITDDGSLYMWGFNKKGQMGIITSLITSSYLPRKPTSFDSKKVTQIALGNQHTAALLEDGSFYMWGYNEYGQLGNTVNVDTTNPNFTPILMSQLGKDSRITANPVMTAKTAVDNLWVDNKFDLTGFKNSFNLTNILDVDDQSITMDDEPTYDNVGGTVTMNINIKYYYNENGLIVANTAETPMTIDGFVKIPVKTSIVARADLVSSIVANNWLAYVKVEGKVDRTKLEEFLILSFIPTDAEFTITNFVPINKTGVLTFDIISSKVIDINDNTQNTPSNFIPFAITLNLTPRVTKMVAKPADEYPRNLVADDLKAKLFNEDGLVIDLNELSKYLTIIAPVDGATYHLVTDSWESSDDGKEVKFSIWVDKYYDADGNQQIGTEMSGNNLISFDLHLTGIAIPAQEGFPWWWILVGVGAAAIIGFNAWLMFKKCKSIEWTYVD